VEQLGAFCQRARLHVALAPRRRRHLLGRRQRRRAALPLRRRPALARLRGGAGAASLVALGAAAVLPRRPPALHAGAFLHVCHAGCFGRGRRRAGRPAGAAAAAGVTAAVQLARGRLQRGDALRSLFQHLWVAETDLRAGGARSRGKFEGNTSIARPRQSFLLC
jgi:hypothetical protein